ncbi:Ser/Thr protein kinase RdoA (MazF antagonist) [Actinopolymorpha rutila]|uniref:Ser/Thr protein kinase RdoA (MazF antagonist) n=2 Tax=Actinopolymorpha rutila TaxID=446787 RepID=A0A852ZES2_9ACTN|nr:Ser/Thr protein kinase RdoA (MazF antagonist) [Actinopolymorpha rutila]
MTPVDWDAGLDEISARHPRLAEWAKVAATSVTDELAALGTAELPTTVIHGDFLAEQNVHYDGDRFVGVIDFAVAHLGSRPYELVSARCYRAPTLLPGYVDEARRQGWPLSDAEEAALAPLRRAFRLVLVAWHLLGGMGTGQFDAAAIDSCLAGTGIDPSGAATALR